MSNVNCLDDKQFVKYIPELNLTFKKVETTLLVGQLEYWFARYSHGFYKFMEPCEHTHYREGDSWTEELSLSRKVFNKAFDLVGVRYKSKSAYDSEEDKFKGKLYASYYDRGENKTYYVRNHNFLKNLFSKKQLPKESASRKTNKNEVPLRNGQSGRYPIYKDITKDKIIPSPPKSPSASTLEEGILDRKGEGEVFSNKGLGENPNLASQFPIVEEISEEEFQKAKRMREIWLKETQGLIETPSMGKKFAGKLIEALRNDFSDSLLLWEKYCEKVGSSKFLTGQTGGKFRLWLARAIKGEVIEKVRGGGYGVNPDLDLSKPSDKNPAALETKPQYCAKIKTTCEGVDLDIKLALLEKLDVSVFKSWFEKATFVPADSETLHVQGLTRFSATYIQDTFFQLMTRIKERFDVERVEFVHA